MQQVEVMRRGQTFKVIYPWPEEIRKFLVELFHKQGATNNYNCTGMNSLSFWPERVTYDASDDSLIRAEWWGSR